MNPLFSVMNPVARDMTFPATNVIPGKRTRTIVQNLTVPAILVLTNNALSPFIIVGNPGVRDINRLIRNAYHFHRQNIFAVKLVVLGILRALTNVFDTLLIDVSASDIEAHSVILYRT